MTTKKNNQLIGAHVSIAGGFDHALAQGEKIGATAIQIFTKNNRSYFASPITQESIESYKAAQKSSPVRYVVVHASYLINIGSNKPEVEKKSVAALKHELERCEQLGIEHLVLHSGAHTGAGVEKCLEKIAKNLDAALEHVPGKTMVLLETAAGQGTTVGKTFDELKTILDLCTHKKRIGICLDTCHIFVAGYDIASAQDYKKTCDDFDRAIGYKHLKLIHINDSKMPCGSKRDRHESIGKGKIPLEAFKRIMNDPHLEKIPKILETPDPHLYKKEIEILKSL